MSADLQFKQLIDRILRCREAEDVAKEDTKEVYAELKALGFDKTAAGALVAELRKQDKNPEQFKERNATLELYRDAYERAGGSLAHTHTREDDEQAATKSAATQFQAKASKDNGRTTGEAGPVAGEASRVDAGRTASATSELMDVTGGESAATSFPSDGDAFAAVKGKARLANVNDVEPSLSGTDPQKPNSSPAADKAEAPSSSPEASATNFSNPRCQHPDTCHFAGTRENCHECLLAWSQRPRDEQVRLWAEANEAARAAA